jgi:outer membrane lipoprotein SlyB
MKTKMLALAAAAFTTAALSGCAETTPRVAERIEYGVVESIQPYRAGNDTPPGVGAVLGGIAGGVIGHQVGGGRGKDVATIAGALGGAYAGNQIQRANERDHYHVTVRLDGGARLEAEETGETELRVGDRVRVVNGRVHRE